ncbi:hypothetical protein ACFIOY_17695 [Bradyrhizobium sp. TZ2]
MAGKHCAFAQVSPRAAQLTRMVNVWFPARSIYGFENGGRAAATLPRVVNQKFTSNRIIQIFKGFSSTLPQCKHLRFIDGC